MKLLSCLGVERESVSRRTSLVSLRATTTRTGGDSESEIALVAVEQGSHPRATLSQSHGHATLPRSTSPQFPALLLDLAHRQLARPGSLPHADLARPESDDQEA